MECSCRYCVHVDDCEFTYCLTPSHDDRDYVIRRDIRYKKKYGFNYSHFTPREFIKEDEFRI